MSGELRSKDWYFIGMTKNENEVKWWVNSDPVKSFESIDLEMQKVIDALAYSVGNKRLFNNFYSVENERLLNKTGNFWLDRGEI